MPRLFSVCVTSVFFAAVVSAAGGQPASAPATRAASRPSTLPSRVTVHETLLYKIPEGVQVSGALASPDGRHIACIEKKDDKFWVCIDGTRSPAHEWVVAKSFVYSPDGRRFAYQVQHDGLMFYVLGDIGPKWQAVEQPGFYLLGPLLFSPDGKRVLYIARKEKDGKQSLIVDGKEQAGGEEITPAEIEFSPSSDRWACRVRDGNKMRYVIDGAPQPQFDAVGGFVFSSDGKRFGYFARTGETSAIVVDGKEGTRYSAAAGLIFSPDAKKYAYVIESPGPAGADGKPTRKQQLVYNAGAADQVFSPFDRIGGIAFSPDSRRLALTALQGQKWSVAVDGKIAGTYDGVGMMKFSPDSRRLAVVAGNETQMYLVIDGQQLPAVDVVGAASFSPNSAQLAFVARVGKLHWLYLNQERLGPATFFSFSPDGKYLGHATLGPKDETWTVALNGEGYGPAYNGFPTGSQLVWDSPTKCHIVAGREKEMYLLDVELTQ
jgi:hypothetical protein